MTNNLPPLPPGFRQTTGKRSPPNNSKRYHIQLRQGFTDTANSYAAPDLIWIWDGSPGDIVAVCDAAK